MRRANLRKDKAFLINSLANPFLIRPLKLWAEVLGSGALISLEKGSEGPGCNEEFYWKDKVFTCLDSIVISFFNSLISLIKILFVHYNTLILVSRRLIRESSSESSSFALEAVYSDAIKAISFKALGAITTGAGALEAATVTVCAGALETAVTAAVTIYTRALETATTAVTATVACVIRLYLGLLRPLGVLMVPNLQFSR